MLNDQKISHQIDEILCDEAVVDDEVGDETIKIQKNHANLYRGISQKKEKNGHLTRIKK